MSDIIHVRCFMSSETLFTSHCLYVRPTENGGGGHLARAAGGALGHGGWVGHIVSQVEKGSSAHQVAEVEVNFCGNLCVGAQQGALPPSLTLDPAAKNITAAQQTQ